MKNIFVISIFAISFVLPQVAVAQNLDPTVEVTREYEGKLVETRKPILEMTVPDSVARFALGFDYSVFENPYKGSYDFNPYLLTMKPSEADMGENRLYLRAGAGYQLHPELDLVWSPKVKNPGFNVDVHALHRSFIGNYWTIAPEHTAGGGSVLDRLPEGASGRIWSGYDLLSRAGVDCRYDSAGSAVGFGVGYYGLAQEDRSWKRDFNALDARFVFGTKPETAESVIYDIAAGYRYARDNVNVAADPGIAEHLFDFDMSFGPVSGGNHKLRFDLGVGMAAYGRALVSTVGEVSLAPRYIFGKNRTHLDVGILLSKLIRGRERGGQFAAREQIVYPDITFSYMLLPKSLKFHLTAKGGNTMNTYSSILEANHHLLYSNAPVLLDCTVERVSLEAGFDGHISSRFSYNVRGGYVNYGNALLDAVVLGSDMPVASLAYSPYQKWFVAMDWCLKTEDFRFDGAVAYSRCWGDVFADAQEGQAVLRPAALTGDISAEYNWRRRVFCGIDCAFATVRKGHDLSVPGYADLGVYAEYVTSRGLSFWLRAGNLLNMTIQRNPLYAEKGINFTAGICLSL